MKAKHVAYYGYHNTDKCAPNWEMGFTTYRLVTSKYDNYAIIAYLGKHGVEIVLYMNRSLE